MSSNAIRFFSTFHSINADAQNRTLSIPLYSKPNGSNRHDSALAVPESLHSSALRRYGIDRRAENRVSNVVPLTEAVPVLRWGGALQGVDAIGRSMQEVMATVLSSPKFL